MSHYEPPFHATADQREILQWVHEFARDQVRPVAAEWDEKEQTPWPVIEKAREIGLYSWPFIQQISADESGVLLPAVLEEMAWADAGICLSLFGTTLALTALLANGTPEQIGTWLEPLFEIDSRAAVAAFCSSESGAGSDVSALRTRAVRDGQDWVLDGTKMWATNGGIAGVHIVVASVEPEMGSRGHAVFLGSQSRTEDLQAWHSRQPHCRSSPRRGTSRARSTPRRC